MGYRPIAAILFTIFLAAPASARDPVQYFDLQPVIDDALKSGQLDGTVTFHLRGAVQPAAGAPIDEARTSRKTNAVNKTSEEACRWATLGALKALQAQAKAKGANAVVDMTSNFEDKTYASATQYECHLGAIAAGVAFKGSYVKLAGKP